MFSELTPIELKACLTKEQVNFDQSSKKAVLKTILSLHLKDLKIEIFEFCWNVETQMIVPKPDQNEESEQSHQSGQSDADSEKETPGPKKDSVPSQSKKGESGAKKQPVTIILKKISQMNQTELKTYLKQENINCDKSLKKTDIKKAVTNHLESKGFDLTKCFWNTESIEMVVPKEKEETVLEAQKIQLATGDGDGKQTDGVEPLKNQLDTEGGVKRKEIEDQELPESKKPKTSENPHKVETPQKIQLATGEGDGKQKAGVEIEDQELSESKKPKMSENPDEVETPNLDDDLEGQRQPPKSVDHKHDGKPKEVFEDANQNPMPSVSKESKNPKKSKRKKKTERKKDKQKVEEKIRDKTIKRKREERDFSALGKKTRVIEEGSFDSVHGKFGAYPWKDTKGKFFKVFKDKDTIESRCGPFVDKNVIREIVVPETKLDKLFGPGNNNLPSDMARYLRINQTRAFTTKEAKGSRFLASINPKYVFNEKQLIGEKKKFIVNEGHPRFFHGIGEGKNQEECDAFRYSLEPLTHQFSGSVFSRFFKTVSARAPEKAEELQSILVDTMAAMCSKDMEDSNDRAVLTGAESAINRWHLGEVVDSSETAQFLGEVVDSSETAQFLGEVVDSSETAQFSRDDKMETSIGDTKKEEPDVERKDGDGEKADKTDG